MSELPSDLTSNLPGLSFKSAIVTPDASIGLETCSIAPDHVSATLTIDILPSAWHSGKAVTEIIGSQSFNGSGLNRTLPWKHPFLSKCYATSIASVQPYGSYINIDGDYAEYDRYRLNIVFSRRPYSLNGLAFGGGPLGPDEELSRFCMPYTEPKLEYVNLERLRLVWAPGTPGKVIAVDSTTGKVTLEQTEGFAVGGTVGVRVPMSQIKWNWYQVPLEIGGTYGVSPTNITDGLGHVNDKAWPTFIDSNDQFPAGTLLMTGAALQPRVALVSEEESDPDYYFDVVFTMLYFEPELGPEFYSTNSNPTYKQYGHNLMPHPTDGYWYPAQAQQTKLPLYDGYDFNKLTTAP